MEEKMLQGIQVVSISKPLMRLLLPLLLLLIFTANGQDVGKDDIQVLEFQKDGVASWWTVAEYQGELDPKRKMDSLTLCGRFKLYFLHSRSSFFQLWDRSLDLDAQLKGELWLDRVRPVIAHRWNFQPLEVKLRTYK